MYTRRILLLSMAAVFASFAWASSTDGQTGQQFRQWFEWYSSRDLRADADGNGRLTPNDFSRFIADSRRNPVVDQPAQPETDAPTQQDLDDGSVNPDDSSGEPPREPYEPEIGTAWTPLIESPDTRKIYVSASGRDTNSGLSENESVRTIAAGIDRLRDGYPDWLMLKRGDTFYEELSGNWKKSGRSSDEPMIVTAYGDGPRPKLVVESGTALGIVTPGRRAHIWFVSLAFESTQQRRAIGLRFVADDAEDILIEDCLVSGFRNGITLQGFGGRVRDVRIRRNVIVDNAGSTHSQGIYIDNTDGVLIEENILDRNGWDYRRGRERTATIFAHNIYVQRNVTDVVFINNWSSRASAEGVKVRSGGTVDGNVIWNNPIALTFGNDARNNEDRRAEGSIIENVVLEASDISPSQPRGWGILIENTRDVDVLRNVVANAQTRDGFAYSVTSRFNDALNTGLRIADNIAYNTWTGLRINERLLGDAVIENNTFVGFNGNSVLFDMIRASGDGVTLQNNRYRHEGLDEPFQDGNRRVDLNQWRSMYDNSGEFYNSDVVSPNADMDSYARSIGYSNAEDMVDALREQRKGAWDSRLTTDRMRDYFFNAYKDRSSGN